MEKYADEVKRLIEERLSVRAPTLETAVLRAGRLLPKWARRDAAYLVRAQTYMAHPKLRLLVDDAKNEKAYAALVAHLKTIDPKERRTTRILGTLGVVSFNLIVVVVALVGVLVWRGYL